jgi:hypothetical protein
VLAVALGIYLPLKLSAAILLGGAISAWTFRVRHSREPSRRGLLFAAGLITGEALMGIILALPIALTGLWPGFTPDPFALFSTPPFGAWPGVIAMVVVATLLFNSASAHDR